MLPSSSIRTLSSTVCRRSLRSSRVRSSSRLLASSSHRSSDATRQRAVRAAADAPSCSLRSVSSVWRSSVTSANCFSSCSSVIAGACLRHARQRRSSSAWSAASLAWVCSTAPSPSSVALDSICRWVAMMRDARPGSLMISHTSRHTASSTSSQRQFRTLHPLFWWRGAILPQQW